MKVEVNKQTIEVGQNISTLEALLKSENLSAPGLAVAVDGTVVRRADWPAFILADGMKIMVIRAVCGG